jgi:hypothetical protein
VRVGEEYPKQYNPPPMLAEFPLMMQLLKEGEE